MSTKAAAVATVRHFNRFYTQRIGVLHEGLLESPFSLTEVRVLYELAQRDRLTATDLARDLGLDAGYLSRILRNFQRRRLITRRPAPADRRRSLLSLTAAGRRAFAPLDARASDEVADALSALSSAEQARLVEAMQTIERLLLPDGRAAPRSFVLRPPEPGDFGWVVHRHGAIYGREYGWGEAFEGLTAEIVARFIRKFDAQRERCWIAEADGDRVGSVFLVRQSKTVARLRLLLVEPEARGMGIGTRLVEACIRFARQAGYRRITLWTNEVLYAARRIYEKAGFRLVHAERHEAFGEHNVGETWELAL